MAADDPGNDAPGLSTTVLIRAPTSRAATEDGRAHYLAVVAGERAGLRIELGGKPVVIGRAPPADLVIDDSQISRKHCRISLVLDEVFVADLGSSNGTMVDGRRITHTEPLPVGARLQIGGHVLEHESPVVAEATREIVEHRLERLARVPRVSPRRVHDVPHRRALALGLRLAGPGRP